MTKCETILITPRTFGAAVMSMVLLGCFYSVRVTRRCLYRQRMETLPQTVLPWGVVLMKD